MEEAITLNVKEIETYLSRKGYLKYINNHINIISIPLVILSVLGIGFILVYLENILVPFIISIFFTYLIRPIVNFLHKPFLKLTSNKSKFYSYFLKEQEEQNEPSITSSEESYLLEVKQNSNNGKNKTLEKYYDFTITINNSTKIHSSQIGCPRILSVILSLMFAILVFIGLIIFFIDAIQEFEETNYKNYEKRGIELAIKFFSFLKRNFDINGSKLFNDLIKDIKVFQLTTSLVYYLSNLLGYVFIIFLFMLYMLLEDKNNNEIMKKIDIQIQRYIIIKTLISAFIGFLVYLILGPLLNVKLANVFGVITFLANYIPNVGAIMATLLPIPILILDQDQTSFSILLAILLPVGIHTIVGNFVEPKVFGDTMELHAVIVLLSLSLWFTIWGISGAILAVPITAVFRIILSQIEHPYAKVMLQLLEGTVPNSSITKQE